VGTVNTIRLGHGSPFRVAFFTSSANSEPLKDNSSFVADGFPEFFYGKVVKDVVAIVIQHSEIIGSVSYTHLTLPTILRV